MVARPSNPTPGIYLEKMETPIQKDTHSPAFIAALFTIAKRWKQLKYPSTDNWLKEMWCACVCVCVCVCIHTCTHTTEYYSDIKKNEILLFAQHKWT